MTIYRQHQKRTYVRIEGRIIEIICVYFIDVISFLGAQVLAVQVYF
jgi:hypothetical protein